MNRASGSGVSIFLIAVGAILYFAVSTSVTGVSLSTIGVILMIVGAVGLVVSFVAFSTSRGRDAHTTVVQGSPPSPVEHDRCPGHRPLITSTNGTTSVPKSLAIVAGDD